MQLKRSPNDTYTIRPTQCVYFICKIVQIWSEKFDFWFGWVFVCVCLDYDRRVFDSSWSKHMNCDCFFFLNSDRHCWTKEPLVFLCEWIMRTVPLENIYLFVFPPACLNTNKTQLLFFFFLNDIHVCPCDRNIKLCVGLWFLLHWISLHLTTLYNDGGHWLDLNGS